MTKHEIERKARHTPFYPFWFDQYWETASRCRSTYTVFQPCIRYLSSSCTNGIRCWISLIFLPVIKCIYQHGTKYDYIRGQAINGAKQFTGPSYCGHCSWWKSVLDPSIFYSQWQMFSVLSISFFYNSLLHSKALKSIW